jgi:peptide/nickel transport system permease protein
MTSAEDQFDGGDPRLPDKMAEASQWRLMWLRFKKHKVALFSLYLLALLYLIAVFAEFLQPFDPNLTSRTNTFYPPQALHLLDTDEAGNTRLRLHVLGYKVERDPLTLASTYTVDPDKKIYIDLFGEVKPYLLAGFIPLNRRLIAPANVNDRFYLAGADRLGRDMLSRTIAGTRISLSIGLVGVGLSLVFGLLIGGMAGYLGGWVDTVATRAMELILSLPTIPIWLGLSAAIPLTIDPLARYFGITVILSLVGWTELARVVRGRFLALRSEDFVTAARLDGGSQARVIFRHMMPSMFSHIIASVTLAIPAMIIAETALSFLGLQPPTISWGVLLKEAQNVRSIAQAPWLFVPGGFVVVAVLALNFLGDGLRDAADPYSQH